MAKRVCVFAMLVVSLLLVNLSVAGAQESRREFEATDLVDNDLKLTTYAAKLAKRAGFQVESYELESRSVADEAPARVTKSDLLVEIRTVDIEDLYRFFELVHSGREPVRVARIRLVGEEDDSGKNGTRVRADLKLTTYRSKAGHPNGIPAEVLEQLQAPDAWALLRMIGRTAGDRVRYLRQIDIDIDRDLVLISGVVSSPTEAAAVEDDLASRFCVRSVDHADPVRVESKDRVTFSLEIALDCERAGTTQASHSTSLWQRQATPSRDDRTDQGDGKAKGAQKGEDTTSPSEEWDGRVTVYAKPKGVIVVDDVRTGQETPGTVHLKSGIHEVQVEFDDELSETKKIRVREDSHIKLFYRR